MACARTIRSIGLRIAGLGAAFGRILYGCRSPWHQARPARICVLAFAILSLAPASSMAAPEAKPLKATLTVTTNDGYARLVFSAGQYIEASTKVDGHVLIISFKRPIDVAVDRLPELASDYIGAARRDPDGSAIRVAL